MSPDGVVRVFRQYISIVMIDVRTKDDCIGCGACAEHCPRRCISFVTDGSGWRRPVVNIDYCLNCGMCENVCPVMVKRAIASGCYFRYDPVEESVEDMVLMPETDTRGQIFDLGDSFLRPVTHSFRAGDCVLSLYGPNDKGRLLKVRDGAAGVDKTK